MAIKDSIRKFLHQAQLFFFILFFVLFSWTQWWAGVAPRLIRGSEERVAIHHAHLSLGATLFVLLIGFFCLWALKPGESFLCKLKNAFRDCTASALSLFFVSSLFLLLYGLSQAWSKGEETPVLGVFNLPHFLGFSWQTSGYMHAALSSISIFLFMGIVFVYLYRQLSKYVEPGVAVAALIVLHLLIALPKPPSLHPIAAFGTYVLTPFVYLAALALYRWANHRKLVYWPVFAFFILFFLYLPFFAFKVLPPWHQAEAKEVVRVESLQELSPIRTRSEIFPDPQNLTDAEDTTAWCRQCHSVNKGDPHLLGPNLSGIFNTQIASVPDYGRYSTVLISKGEDGNFWTRETLSEYLTDGQAFAPGNLMNQQTDFSDPVKLKQAIDYLEYISAEEVE